VTSEEDDDDYEEEELVIDLKESEIKTCNESVEDEEEEEEAGYDTNDEDNSNNDRDESINGSQHAASQSNKMNNLNNFGQNKRRNIYSIKSSGLKYESDSPKTESNE